MFQRKISHVIWLGLILLLSACSLNRSLVPSEPAGLEATLRVETIRAELMVVRNNQRAIVAPGQGVSLGVGDRAILAAGGQGALAIPDLLAAELLQAGEVSLETFDGNQQLSDIGLRQSGGTVLYTFNAAKTADHRLTINTDLGQITTTGARFLLAQDRPDLLWVVNLGDVTDQLQVSAGGDSQIISSDTARWLATNQRPSDSISTNSEQMAGWLAAVRVEPVPPPLGDLLFAPADITGRMGALTAIPPPGQPFEFTSGGQNPVRLTLAPLGLFGSPTYRLEDCDGDGRQELAVLAGIVEFSFAAVMAQTRALDVTILNRDLPGNGALWALDEAENEIARQLIEAETGQQQTLSLRSNRSYQAAKLAVVNSCLLGFSLTPPTSAGTPAPPRAILPEGQSTGVVVNLAGGSEPEPEVTAAQPLAPPPVVNTTSRRLDENQIEALRLGRQTLSIDGLADDWAALTQPGGPDWLAFSAVIFDNGCANRYPGQAAQSDLAGQVRFAYDETALYVAFQVEDDGYVGYSGNSFEVFLGDAPQLSLDMALLSDLTDPVRNSDDWQVDFYPEPSAPRVVLWQLANLSARDFSEARVAAHFSGANYFLEATLPWAAFGAAPQPGERIGLAANVNDNDTPNTNSQECIISTAPGRTWHNPTTWGTLLLGAE